MMHWSQRPRWKPFGDVPRATSRHTYMGRKQRLKKMKRAGKIWLVILVGVSVYAYARPLPAQESSLSIVTTTKFYVDQKSGQVFVRPANGRVPLVIGGAV